MGCLYLITNVRNGKGYVGWTVAHRTAQSRWASPSNSHCAEARWKLPQGKKRRAICVAIRKHGPDAFTVEEIVSGEDHEPTLKMLEQTAILWLGTRAHGYNETDGGDGTVNPSPETRAKISAANRRPEQLAHLARLSAAPEVRAKISAANRRPENLARRARASAAPEVRAKLSAAGRRPENQARSREQLARLNASPEQRERRAHINVVQAAERHAAFWTDWQHRCNTDSAFREGVRQAHERRWARLRANPETRARMLAPLAAANARRVAEAAAPPRLRKTTRLAGVEPAPALSSALAGRAPILRWRGGGAKPAWRSVDRVNSVSRA